MNPRGRLFLFIAIACLLAIALAAPRLALRDRRLLQGQPAAAARWEQQIRQARQQRDVLLRQLEAAHQPPSRTATAPANEPPASDLIQLTETDRWVRQTKQLRQLFARLPDQVIPEFAVLDDQDWLSLARRVQLDTEDQRQRALALVRNEAKDTFVQSMQDALAAFLKANHDQLPTDPTELQPYLFAPTLDPAMLARYEMVRSGALGDAPEGPVLKEKNVVDDDYDARMTIRRNADASLTAGAEWKRNPETPDEADLLNDQIDHDVTLAVRAFVGKNPSTLPKSPAELIPYFDPPLGPAMTEMINHPLTAAQQKEFEADVAARAGGRRPAK